MSHNLKWYLKMAILAGLIALIWSINSPARGGEITDLGIITPTSLITLEKCERRKDFHRFKIEILPRNARGWTNKIEIVTTNDFLKIDDLAAVPEGLAIMGVRSYCANGDVSPVALFKIDVHRAPPDKPKASVSTILSMPNEQKIEHVIEAVTAPDPTPAPPALPGMTNPPPAVPTRSAHPLPGGTNSTYAQYQATLERMAREGLRLKNNR